MSRRRPDWLPVREALDRILAAVTPLPPAERPLADALGAVLAEPIVSPIDQPPWDNSAMDGFAVRAEEIAGASEARPVELRVTQDVPAGHAATRALGPGEAARIMTGAPVPAGADTVVRIEHTDQWDAERPGELPYPVRIRSDDDARRNIRRRGEDLRRGVRILEAGCTLRPPEIGLLAATGHATVLAHRRPRVAILSNGDELVEPERIAEVVAGRAIVNSNSYSLAAAVAATGATPLPLGIARDDEGSIREHLEAASHADALVTSAGASVGDHDRLKDVLESLGFQLDFWRVTMRPGSPFSFGMLPRGSEAAGAERVPAAARGPEPPAAPRRLPVFGLAGNPVSALVTFEVLVRPAIRRMLGRRQVHPRTLAVRLAEPFPAHQRLTHFLRARLEHDGAEWRARLTGPQGSGILRSVAEADALVIVPAGAEGLPAGATAIALPLDELDPAAGEPAF